MASLTREALVTAPKRGDALSTHSLLFPLVSPELDALPNFSPVSLRRYSPPYAICVQFLMGCLWL